MKLNSCFLRKHGNKTKKTKKKIDSIDYEHEIGFNGKESYRNYISNGNFHEAIGSVLAMAQCFGLMPVYGIKSKSTDCLQFSWTKFRTIYCILFILLTIIDTGFTCYKVFYNGFRLDQIEPVVFHLTIFLASTNLLILAQKWPKLMCKWEKVENCLPAYTTHQQKTMLANKIKMVTMVALMVSLSEHLLSTITAIHFANYCPARKDPIESYFITAVDQLFFVFDYSPWIAWAGKTQNVLMTFTWTYMDVFIMLISIGLSKQFQQLNDSLKPFKGMTMPEVFWKRRREQYRMVCNLIEDVDDAISIITMVSFTNNLYFICIQLLKSINSMPSFAHGVYFYFSLFFLLGRTLAVSLYSAEINERSKEPLMIFRCVPSNGWLPEVSRFFDEVNTDLIALSGMRFFHITRKLVLTVAGTIVTYELVLIQFHEDKGDTWNCGK